MLTILFVKIIVNEKSILFHYIIIKDNYNRSNSVDLLFKQVLKIIIQIRNIKFRGLSINSFDSFIWVNKYVIVMYANRFITYPSFHYETFIKILLTRQGSN